VGEGDEVVMPSLTFYATAEAALNAGATPVFCDVDPDTYCVTRATVEAAMTERTRAVVPVHLFGNVADARELRALGVPVVEDAAQSAGATLAGRHTGALGDAATFSFYPSKNLGALGDGGAIVTDRDDVADAARRLRFHGSTDKETFGDVGYNSRLDELQAAALRVLLPELDGWTDARRAAAAAYEEAGLADVPGLQPPRVTPGAGHAYHLYVARHERADELIAALGERGIGARGYYRVPVHLQPAMAPYGADALDLPSTAGIARSNLALPMGTSLGPDDVARVVEACAAAAGG
jgi:dTDP-4-amino-4,6-dideoxygalactose transaminase